ncbi:MAG: phosphate ABC transporter permease subunit PstC [Blastochloris sp.]|nr:phosphate ABC transporter permease subunit PstC [Blastochloris sp.]
MPETLEIKRLDQRPMTESLLSKNKVKFLGLGSDEIIKYFFSGSAWTAIIVLALITFSLFREGAGFFPQHHDSLKLYRLAGLEFVDYFRDQMTAQASLSRYLNELKLNKTLKLQAAGKGEAEIESLLAPLEQLRLDFDQAGLEGQALLDEMTSMAAGIKDRYTISEENRISRKQLIDAGMKEEADLLEIEDIDFAKEAENLKTTFLPKQKEVSATMAAKMKSLLAATKVENTIYEAEVNRFKATVSKYITGFDSVQMKMQDWTHDKPVPFYESITKFITGTKWVTQSFWQDWYGIVPLFIGSLTVSIVALIVAVPLGVGAAIYINQVASIQEQNFVKPFIEFVAVIPSVVLGFFGIAVLGEGIRVFTQWDMMAWVPGFPIAERLNIITAGLLLALMAVPSIFTFSEDALNNVPKAYKEASFSLGANRLQTISRIMVPASLSGIISAILLGFGRVIGETMVVLLVAGNRLEIPDFSAGLMVIFQPVHTMTGLVAQEIPEVVKGSLQYRALFVLAIALFLISLLINYVAQIFVRKYKISVG